MSKLQAPELILIADNPAITRHPWWRILTLCLLCLLAVIIYILLMRAAPESDDHINSFLNVWMISFLPYFAACAFVLTTKPLVGRWRWFEVGRVLFGAFLLRGLLLSQRP